MMDGASAPGVSGFRCAAAQGDSSRPFAGSDLPDGFVPLRRVKSLALQGRWAVLGDRMPPWLPFKTLVQMSQRENDGDADAHAWLELYRRAAQGDARAQREMGHACESGAYGCEVDLDRAFFWFHRAGLAGDTEATENALRLKGAFPVSAAAMAEPALVYAGQWRITRDDLDGLITTAHYDLAEDGSMSSEGRAGRWHYDSVHRILTIDGPKQWRIRMVGCRETTLFGRDQHLVTYVIERAAPFKQILRPD